MGHTTVYLLARESQLRTETEDLLRENEIHIQSCSDSDQFFRVFDTAVPCCLVLHLSLPHLTSLAVVEQLHSCGYCPPYILTSDQLFKSDAGRMIRFGSFDFFTVSFNHHAFVSRIHEALALDRTMRSQRADQLVVANRVESLTEREREVMLLVLDGKLSKQIAKQLEISVKTVEAHRSNIIRKMQVYTFTQAACAFSLHS